MRRVIPEESWLRDTEAKRYEAKKIESAITSDFVLRTEIVVITLNVVSEALKPSPTLYTACAQMPRVVVFTMRKPRSSIRTIPATKP